MVTRRKLENQIKFVHIIKNHPYLWNEKHQNKDIVEQEWRDVAKEMSSTVTTCRKRLRTLRDGLIRGHKSDKKGNSYYLAKYLDFLLPYTFGKEVNLPNDNQRSDDMNDQNMDQCEIMVDDQEVTEKTPDIEEFNMKFHNSKSNLMDDEEDTESIISIETTQDREALKAKRHKSKFNADEDMKECWIMPDGEELTATTSIAPIEAVETSNQELHDNKYNLCENVVACWPVIDDHTGTSTETARAIEELNKELHNSKCIVNEDMNGCWLVMDDQEVTETAISIETAQAIAESKGELHKHKSNTNKNMNECVIVSDDEEIPTTTKFASIQPGEPPNKQPDRNKNSTSKNVNLSMPPIPKKIKNNNSDHHAGNAVQVQHDKKKNNQISGIDGNDLFLESLLPHLQNMTGKQNRRFQQRVIALVDEVLDDSDISPPSRPALTQSTSYPTKFSPANSLHHNVNGNRTFTDLTGEIHDNSGKACKYYSLI